MLLAAAAAALSTACAHRPPSTAPRPAVPVVPASAEGVTAVLGRPTRRAAAPADASAARVFEHTPGVTWDLDVLPFEGHERVQHYVALFTGGARERFGAWLSRGSRYEPLVRARLRAGDLPEDLYYLPLVESGYDVHAVSRVGAAGMWQFMPETGRGLGLRLDWWVDERRDPVRATDAAVRMMRWLRGQFGSLFVAAAAYNGGPGRVSRGMALVAAGEQAVAAATAADSAAAAALAALDGGARGDAPRAGVPTAPSAPRPTPAVGEARFFALADAGVIAAETRNYVPQLIAAALVAKEAARYRIAVRREAPLAYDEVEVPPLTPLAVVAEAAGASRAELLDLNPHILRGVTPPGAAYWVRVPAGRGDAAGTRLDALDDDRRAFRRVVTKKRESLEALAERAGVSAGLLRTYNPGLETVERGQYRGRLVGNQAVRVPTAEVLAYARSTPAYGAASGLPSLPAPPPEPAPAPKPTRAAARASARETARERESTDVARGARGAAPAKADKAKPAKADKAEPAKRLAAKGASAKAAPAKAASAKAAPARAAAEKAAPAKGAPAKTGTRAGDGKSTRAGDGKPAAGEGTKATVPAKPTAKQAAKKKDRAS